MTTDRLTAYTDQIQERLDRLERMEPAFRAMRRVLLQAIEGSGFSISGPTNHRVAEHNEPFWVCNARNVLACVEGLLGGPK